MLNGQVIHDEKQKAQGFSIARIVADAGIEAAQTPIKLLVPAVAAILSWRTLTLGLQIFVESEMFRNRHRSSSKHPSVCCCQRGKNALALLDLRLEAHS